MVLNIKKIAALIIIGILFAIIGWVYPLNTGTIWVVNNTNLAPDAGTPHPPGTGERVSGVTYWANNSPIQIFVYAHASTVADTAEIHLSINGTIVADTSGRPIGGAESSNKTIIATIPQYANYSVEFLNSHHYEWREYPILTGEVTTNITTTSTGTGAGCEGNCSFDGIWVNSIRKNDTSDAYGTYINLSSPFRKYNVDGDIFSHMSINDGLYYNFRSQNITSGNYSDIIGTSEGLTLSVTDGLSNNWNMYQDHTRYLINTREYNLNQSELSLGGANITNVNNINSTGIIRVFRNTNIPLSTSTNDVFYGMSNQTVGVFTLQSANNLTLGASFAGALARGNDTNLLPLAASDRMLNVAANGWKGDALASSASIDFYADTAWNTTSSPSRVTFRTTNISQTTRRDIVSFMPSGNMKIHESGKGITMFSPDGNDWCVTVSNAGALTISSTPCS